MDERDRALLAQLVRTLERTTAALERCAVALERSPIASVVTLTPEGATLSTVPPVRRPHACQALWPDGCIYEEGHSLPCQRRAGFGG